MVTATFQLKDQNTYDNFKLRHDSEVRGSDPRACWARRRSTNSPRWTIATGSRKEIVDSVSAMFPKGAILNLFFPQFVIQ